MRLIKYSLYIVVLFISSLSYAQDAGFKEIQLTTNDSDNRYASYNKLGNRIIFESNRDGNWQIYIMDTDSLIQKRVMTNTFNDRRPTWHPTKNIILFESDRNGINDIYNLDLNTNQVTKIPIRLKSDKSFAQYAPNGDEIIFNIIRNDKNSDIYKVHQKGKRLKKVIDNKNTNLYPHLSPKGDEVIYYSNKNAQGDTDIIYTYNIFTKDRSRLTYFKNQSYHPMWSNKRNQIAYVASIKDEKPEIYKMRVDGTNKARVTFNDVDDCLPNWSPDDSNLLITGFRNGHYHICKILLKQPIKQKEGVKNTIRD